MTNAETADLLADLSGQYELLRVLPDGCIVGLHRLMYTTAIYIDLNQWGFERRYCFDNRTLALQRFAELQSADDEPAGYTARRT